MVPYHDEDYSDKLPLEKPTDLMEWSGRWDYGPASIKNFQSNPDWLKKRLAEGEESMVEMGGAMFFITCSRVVSHELVRHRIASYQQESQRFVKYKDELVEELMFLPPELESNIGLDGMFQAAMRVAKVAYDALIERGVKPQIARYVFPNATRTRIVVMMNPRQWRHVLRLRLHTSAQPEMRIIMSMVHAKLQRIYGSELFPDDIADERSAR
jgi:thymidylate synthase (FAD)